MTFHNWFLIYQGNGVLGTGCVVGFMKVKFVVVLMSINVHVLTKFA